MVKRVGKYKIGKTLGEGTFGKVKLALNEETGERVAIKVLDKEKIQKQNMGAQIKKEISIMKMVKHRHVVSLKEVLASRTKIFIVLELVTGGELFDKIVSEGRFSEENARFYFRQLINGVSYCHKQGVCHRDLKPENLLLDEQSWLKISDFGLSALYENAGEGEGEGGETSRTQLLHTTCGTPNYVAPEVLNDRGYDGRAADIWSCGVILYVLLAGYLPFDEPTMSSLFRKIQKAEFAYPPWFSAESREFLDKILVADPRQRLTVDDVAQDPWFTFGQEEESSSAASEGKTADSGSLVQPSEQDMKEAIQENLEEEEEASKAGSGSGAGGPKSMNAFELINMCGGLALHGMFQSGAEKDAKKVTQFACSQPAADIIARMSAVLSALGCELRVMEASYKIKAAVNTPHGAVGINVQVFTLAGSLHLVELRRGRGDILGYHTFLPTVLAEIGDLVEGDGSASKK